MFLPIKVVELLGHAPQCSILFHQFIPAYHHHYGHQCKVADFGFSKLIELFEAIPDIVKVSYLNFIYFLSSLRQGIFLVKGLSDFLFITTLE